jgi:hypothetical protein
MSHDTEVRRDTFRRDHWQARCSCGWRGDLKPREIEAERDAQDHRDSTAGTQSAHESEGSSA